MYLGTEEEKESQVVTFLFYYGTVIKLTGQKLGGTIWKAKGWFTLGNIRNSSGLITEAGGAEGRGGQ